MTGEIAALCRAMGAAPDQEELLLPLIQAVCRRLAGQLRAGTAPEDCGSAFPLAAAMTVMDQLSGISGGGSAGEMVSFTAGDLTVKKETGGGTARSLSDLAGELLAPWTRDAGFCFRGVEG